MGGDNALVLPVPLPSNRPPPVYPNRSRQVSEHKFHVHLKAGFRFGILATSMVEFAGVSAQFFYRQRAQSSAGKRSNQRVQQRHKFRIVERISMVVREEIFYLDSAETYDSRFCIGRLLLFGVMRRGK